jgi:hypothetical protein
MKNLFVFLSVLILVTSCKKENIAKESAFNKSYNAWLSYKSKVNNSYTYTTIRGSWTGYGVEIKTAVTKGEIILRDFSSFHYNPNTADKIIIKEWHEDAEHINTHGDEAGDPLTLDGVYQKSRTVWLKADNKTNDIYFEANNNGMISSCGFVPKGCQDDCFNGINIATITSL